MSPKLTCLFEVDVEWGRHDAVPSPPSHEHRGNTRAIGQSRYHGSLQFNYLPAAQTLIGGDDHVGLCYGKNQIKVYKMKGSVTPERKVLLTIVDARRQRFGAEAGEDHRMNSTDPSTSQHGRYGQRTSWHVNCDSIPFVNATRFEYVRYLIHHRI